MIDMAEQAEDADDDHGALNARIESREARVMEIEKEQAEHKFLVDSILTDMVCMKCNVSKLENDRLVVQTKRAKLEGEKEHTEQDMKVEETFAFIMRNLQNQLADMSVEARASLA